MANARRILDKLNRSIAIEVVRRFEPDQIRAKILENLVRWEAQGMWCSSFEDWRHIAESKDDAQLLSAMVGWDENADQLRQSAPLVGLLPRDVVRDECPSFSAQQSR